MGPVEILMLIALVVVVIFELLCWAFWRLVSAIGYRIGLYLSGGTVAGGKKGQQWTRRVIFLIVPLFYLCIYLPAENYYLKNKVRNFCKKEAGFFVYVDPERWKKEMFADCDSVCIKQRLKGKKAPDIFRYKGKIFHYTLSFVDEVPELAVYMYRREKPEHFTVRSSLLVEIKTGHVLAEEVVAFTSTRLIWYESEPKLSVKFWLNNSPKCFPGQDDAFIDIFHKFEP